MAYRKYYDDLCWTFAPQAIVIGVTVFALWIALEPWKSGESPPAVPSSSRVPEGWPGSSPGHWGR